MTFCHHDPALQAGLSHGRLSAPRNPGRQAFFAPNRSAISTVEKMWVMTRTGVRRHLKKMETAFLHPKLRSKPPHRVSQA
jgi:hypothetical protein